MALGKIINGWREITSGYRLSLVCGALTCLLTLLLNTAATIWAGTLPDIDGEGNPQGRRVLYEGSCDKSKMINTVLHLVINLLSSVLLSASNYGIQCLSAPTREQIDRTHAQNDYLDIGIVSIRNLFRQTRCTQALWLTLFFSSVPLHLLYNSVIFSSLTVPSEYTIIYADERLLYSEGALRSALDSNITYAPEASSEEKMYLRGLLESSFTPGNFENLTTADCITEYGTSFLTSRRDVILVHDFTDGQNMSLDWDRSYIFTQGPRKESFAWICDFPASSTDRPIYTGRDKTCRADLGSIRANHTNWRPDTRSGIPGDGDRVKHCLSKPIQDLCRVNFNIFTAISVIVCNLVKLAILAYITLYLSPDRLLVLGDGIQSFLSRPDVYSKNSCLLSMFHIDHSRTDIYQSAASFLESARHIPELEPQVLKSALRLLESKHHDNKPWLGGRQLESVQRHWISTVRKQQLGLGGLMYLVSVVSCLILLLCGIYQMTIPRDWGNLWSLGFGQATEQTLLSGPGDGKNLTGNAILANMPHLIFSFIYFQWNAIFTSMLAGREWNNFALNRVSLRVSDKPEGKQRSRYFLQLPFRFSIPLIAASIAFHWLISQSIFVVSVEERQQNDALSWGVVTCGYSPVAIVVGLIAGITIPVSVVIVGRQRLAGLMPIAGSCSLAIAAACHHPAGSAPLDSALGDVKWGVMNGWRKERGQNESIEGEQEGRGLLDPCLVQAHCGFSIDDVEEPQVGCMYE